MFLSFAKKTPMKKLLVLVGVILLFACGNSTENTEQASSENKEVFGETFDGEGALPLADFINTMQGSEMSDVKIIGTVSEVCQTKGCWMSMEKGDGSTMRITFKDYGFFVPKDCNGKQAIISGKAYMDTTSVEDLKHYAKDAGKTDDEINQITQPEVELAFEASGVILK